MPDPEVEHHLRSEIGDGGARAAGAASTGRGRRLFGVLLGLLLIGGGDVWISFEVPSLVKIAVRQRNLEKEFGTKVIDRTGLILEIFGRRARTREGALQVELAHLNYQKSRLVRSWTHLERQRGGFGFLGGPGETQIESDRRVISERIWKIEAELEKVKKRRNLHRAGRERVPYPIAALV